MQFSEKTVIDVQDSYSTIISLKSDLTAGRVVMLQINSEIINLPLVSLCDSRLIDRTGYHAPRFLTIANIYRSMKIVQDTNMSLQMSSNNSARDVG